jgi:translation initiation factor 1A
MVEQKEASVWIRYPKKGEVLGIVEEKLGGAHFKVAGTDGKIRLCRIPGSMKRSLWIDIGMVVLVSPWETQSDERGDIIGKYKEPEADELRKKKLINF